jgi:hypothetical protein
VDFPAAKNARKLFALRAANARLTVFWNLEISQRLLENRLSGTISRLRETASSSAYNGPDPSELLHFKNPESQ